MPGLLRGRLGVARIELADCLGVARGKLGEFGIGADIL